MGRETTNRIIAACFVAFSGTVKADIVVAVVDTGFNPKLSKAPICSNSSVNIDTHYAYHGTNVSDLIYENAGSKGYCILPIPVIKEVDTDMIDYVGALNTLTYLKVDVLNLSISGRDYSSKEVAAVKKLLDKGVVVFAAAGNNSSEITKDRCEAYPACDDGRIKVIGSIAGNSNHGDRVDIVMAQFTHCLAGYCLQGTSQATGIATGRYVKFLLGKIKGNAK